ncbi:histidine kinase N-terminal 7TM domain-containing diguanylate cyclase [Clostridium felsineum]|uniref:Uncharacterized protein n=2 Tax=Clostridium felsineum TaxID=36839 RepID=A0A1S8KZH8_9CLOT|nr:diguanylate cyclase [Clostridium felsineum]URZ07038.1 hypothetical protein CLROS_023710 [Clostridium felsineum]URZ12068.1 hypothetical protein CROST_027850 [Clostridium felsineum]
MGRINDFLSSFLYIETFSIIVIAIYSWRRRKALGAFPLLFLCFSSAIYSFGYGMEITSTSLESVNLCSKFEYMGLSFIPVLWVIQAYSLANKDKKISNIIKVLIFIIPTLTCIFRIANDKLNFMYRNEKLISNGYFYILTYEKCFWYYIYYSFFFGCIVISTIMYYKAFLKASGLARRQLKIIIFISISAILFEGFDQLQIVPIKMDYGAFIMFFVYVLFAAAVYPFDIMHIIPVSREIIFDWIYDGVIVMDTNFNLKDFNYAAKEIFKCLDKSLIGTKLELCTSEACEFMKMIKIWYSGSEECSKKLLDGGFIKDTFEFRINSKGSVIYFKARLKALYYHGYRVGSTILISNVTKEKEEVLELEKMARFDQLTGLLSRAYFTKYSNVEFDKLHRKNQTGVLVMIDIDYFKRINDTYGHQAGDHILKEMAFIAKNMLRNKDLIGRYGGEEFIAFLPQLSLKQAKLAIECIRLAFQNHDFFYEDKLIKVTASFGMVECCKRTMANSYEQMVKKADIALYEAKKNGRNRIAVY